MPVCLQIADLSCQEALQLTCYSFRITTDDNHSNYISFIKKYLERLKIVIISSSCGRHTKASKDHFHYHLMVSEPEGHTRPVKQKMNQHFRDFLKLKIHGGLALIPPKHCLSIDIRDNQEWTQSLGYPLKEKQPITEGCLNINVEELMEAAHEIFKNAKPTKQEKKQEQAELAKLCHEYLDQHKSEILACRKELDIQGQPFIWMEGSYREAIKLARKFYLENSQYTPNTPCGQAMKWLNKTGILTDDDLISMYSPLGRLKH